MNTVESKAIFWHRRDLRINDNAGLFKALKKVDKIYPIFIFDSTILEKIPKNDQRVIFIYNSIKELKSDYNKKGVDLLVYFGDPKVLIPSLSLELNVSSVYTNNDYEPNAIKRDLFVYNELAKINISFIGAKDHVIFEKNEIVKGDNSPYTVFTPYMKKWKEKLNDFYLKSYPSENKMLKINPIKEFSELPTLEQIGFSDVQNQSFPSRSCSNQILTEYAANRDYPELEATSKLGLHLRFGTISIRELARESSFLSTVYLNELIWRDFYQMIIYQFPYSEKSAFKKKYDLITWDNNEVFFNKWCEGKTGYPIVDAGMRELNSTGFMHNRVRMIVASFLTKHLLIDWKWGETYFAEKLLDYDLASNVGGWQWAASSGCDASPYFRVFNPTLQQQKFDKEFKSIKKWVKEFGTSEYPEPIIEHSFARERVISLYKKTLAI